MNYVIVGNSAAGLFAVEEIRRRTCGARITLLAAEREPFYSRCLMTYFLAGDIPVSRLYLREKSFEKNLGLEPIYGARITALDSRKRVVSSADGREWAYDRLLLAMGASAVKPEIPGGNLPEVFTLRTLADAKAIENVILRGARTAVVVGGGLVGLKTAYALRKRGLGVVVVVTSGQILSQMLDETAAGLIQHHLETYGLSFRLHSDILAIHGESHVRLACLKGGEQLEADMVIIGKGVHPNTENLHTAGLEIGRGIRVNSSLATNLPDVYAAGDLAETWDRIRGTFALNATWPNATAQGRMAGANMSGGREIYPGSFGLNSVDFFGLAAISAGITNFPGRNGKNTPKNAPEDAAGAWHQAESLKAGRPLPIYRKLIWQGDVLKGYILVGDISRAGILTGLIASGRRLRSHEPDRRKYCD